MQADYRSWLDEAKSLPDIFELVKSLVLKSMNKSRGGLILGIANLGNNPQGYFGGFFTTGSNVIVLNNNPLQRIMETRPEYTSPMSFRSFSLSTSILCFLDESDMKSKVFEIKRAALGEKHLATQIAADARVSSKILPIQAYLGTG